MDIGRGHRVRNRHAFGHGYVAGIEAGVHFHYHHASLSIAGHDSPVDRCRPAPAWQQ